MWRKEILLKFIVRKGVLLFLAVLLGAPGCGGTPDHSDPGPGDIADLPQIELPQIELPVDAGPPLGGIGDPCSEDTECADGYCVQTAEGKACSEICTDECPEDWACQEYLGPDDEGVSICMDPNIKLCSPCNSDDDCQGDGANEQARCIDFGDREGSFCGVDCSSDQAQCAADYICTDLVNSATGAPLRQCLPESESCSCSPWAMEMEAVTHCGEGSCDGERVCGLEGLTECSAQEATEELCDGIDNDCDETPDNGLTEPLADNQNGVCVHAAKVCAGAEGWQEPDYSAITGHESVEITCDGVDNDCDGTPDNGLTPQLADNQNGVCVHAAKVCAGAEGWQEPDYSTLEGYESVEITCDGVDNNCNGSTDEALGSTTCGLGPCIHNVENCINGVAQICDPLEGATEEICDWEDNNCNGLTDEALGFQTCGLGACVHTTKNCIGGLVQTCDPLEGATEEICDGLDNNCNGSADEDLGSTTCGLGACAHTTENCVAGSPQFCNPFEGAAVENCDGIDNNCDGGTDEALGSTTCGLGACLHTIENCVGGVPQICDALEGATDETCDSVDNNCDGNTDEALGSTTCGLGACVNTIDNCIGGLTQVCDPFLGSKIELCDGTDNNCDGATDESLGSTTCGLGACVHTIENCVGGVSQICDTLEGAIDEVCDGIDNNCDGATDESLGNTTCGLGACLHTIDNCVGGLTQSCDALEGVTDEVCDGVDNNCDGATDEALGSTTCGLSPCLNTIDNCIGGLTQVCDPFLGSTIELCDGTDNDCDGVVDEDFTLLGSSCSIGTGFCESPGIWICAPGPGDPLLCAAPIIDPVPEVCDNIDNNCDGNTDEALGNITCGQGACLHTIDNCAGGLIQTCDPLEGSSVEICDNIDNDCNGLSDENQGETTCGVGICEHTIQNCVAGSPQICDPLASVPPAPPGAITGPANVCPNTGGYVYSIASYAGVTSFNWTVPAGATVDDGQGTESVTVSFGATLGDVSVTATNICTTTTASTLVVSDSLAAFGGAITEEGGRRIHTFTTTGSYTLTVTGGCADAEILVVGGGGKGGTSGSGGGGGAGHVIHETAILLTAGEYSGVVGNGGIVVPNGYSGGDNGGPAQASNFGVFHAPAGTMGTGPGGDSGNIIDGVTTIYTGGAVLASPSNGGGAGAGANGGNGSSTSSGPSGNGGQGLLIDISGTLTWYGGGGGAGYHCGANCPGTGYGGDGGGGDGAQGGSCGGCFPKIGNQGNPALPNTGGGGGGGGGQSGCCHGYGGSGGSGIVIISYTL